MEKSLWTWIALFLVAGAGVMVFLRLVTNEIHQSESILEYKRKLIERKRKKEEAARKRREKLEEELNNAAETTPAPPTNGRSTSRNNAEINR